MEKVDKFEIINERKNGKIWNFIVSHKFISIIFLSFFVFSAINFYLIYSFLKILENI